MCTAPLTEELEAEIVERQAEASERRVLLTKALAKLAEERGKLLQAFYANAIPLDLLKAEQDRIGAAEQAAKAELETTEGDLDGCLQSRGDRSANPSFDRRVRRRARSIPLPRQLGATRTTASYAPISPSVSSCASPTTWPSSTATTVLTPGALRALQVRCGSVTKHGQPSCSKRAITAPRCSRAILMYSMSAVSLEVGWIRVESCKQARPYLAVPVEARVRKAPTRGKGFAHRQGKCSRSYWISCQGGWSHGGC
jgi:hypothetical protein